jgi:ribonuclease HI
MTAKHNDQDKIRHTLSEKKITIYTDGACSGNQFDNNLGGWGAIVSWGHKQKQIHGGVKNTTNQRMELTACIKALEEIKVTHIPIELYSDSAYIVNCFNQRWYEKWEKNGWKTAKKQPVENMDLWKRLIRLTRAMNVTFIKVKAHSGDRLNELADALSKMGIANLQES